MLGEVIAISLNYNIRKLKVDDAILTYFYQVISFITYLYVYMLSIKNSECTEYRGLKCLLP